MKTKITYIGNCPRCGKEQKGDKESEVDFLCWNCSVNANLERHDIMRDIEIEIKKSGGLVKLGLEKAIDIVKKYDN